ncbi:MAG: PAS domain S-box protein, partial [Comamonadaceae bacterium]
MQLLLVEDNPGDARLIREMLNDELGHGSFGMRVAGSVDGAMAALQEGSNPSILLLDLSLPDSFGLDTFHRIQAVVPSMPIIVLTGNQDHELALSAVKAGAQDFLVKSDLTGHLLVKAIQYAGERKQIEASLRVNEARFRSLAELSSDWYWEQDTEGRLTYVSEGLKEKSGIDPARLTGACWWDIEELDPNGGWDGLRQKMQAHEAFNDVLLRYATDAPEAVYLTISGVPVTSDAGAFAGYRGVGKDVSARERIDAALRGSEERYRQMMDSARDGILMFDADGLVTFANLRICSMLGYGEAEICGRSLAAFGSQGSGLPGGTGAGTEGGFELRRKDGSSLWTMTVTYPVTAKDGTHAGTLSIFTDITEFKAQEERIRQLAALAAEKSEAERANLAKSRFLAAVSHDLRQPMHALGLFIEDLRSARLDGAAAGVLDNMESALDLTNGLLDTILVMSGLESGMVNPSVTAFPVQRLLDRVAQAFSPVAEKKGLRLSVIPSSACIKSDPVLLERVILNLVSNAVRYTDKGGVAVACRSRGGAFQLQVWDTGLGIPREFRDS